MARARITVERGVVGFGLDYSCTHIIKIIILASVNLLPIQADFVTERDIMEIAFQFTGVFKRAFSRRKSYCINVCG